MANSSPSKKTRFGKGNKVAKANKGKQKRKTIIKNVILGWTKAEEVVEKNIMEALQSKNKRDRVYATRYFAEFVKPKKKELSGELKEKVEVTINDYTE